MSDASSLEPVEPYPFSARLYTAADPALNGGSREVVFIEDNVAHWETLIPNVKPGVDVVVLDSRGDGLSQMADWVKNRPAYDAIHVISHGSEGRVDLGALTLDSATAETRSADLANLGSALTANGDLLLYGCGIGGGTGTAFLSLLAKVTGADVSASADVTGAATLGGNWTLEAASGTIEAKSLAFPTYDGILPTTLSAGDLAVVNFNASTDTFKVVALADISAGTTINFTDRGWSNTYGAFVVNAGREGTLSWTTTSDIAAGSVLSFSVNPTSRQFLNLSAGGNLSGTFSVSDWGNSGADYVLGNQDQIIIYQGSDTSPTFIFGYNNNAASTTSWWDSPVSGSSYTQSNLPGTLSLGTTAIGTPNGSRPYAGYTGDISAATPDVWLSRLANPGNWTLAGSTGSAVTDTIGNHVTVMVPPRVVTVTAENISQSAARTASYSFSIQYTDTDNGIAAASIGKSDVSVKRAGGSALTVTNATWDAATNTATYTVAAPGGSWDDGDNGVYTIAIGSNEIADDSGLTMAANASVGSFTVSMDTTAPNAPSITAITNDTGSSATDFITRNTTPIFAGTAESGSTVTLYDTDGTTVLGTGTAAGGNWSITTPTLSQGTHTITAKATDAAGNTSSASATQSVTIDTTGPAMTSVSVPADGTYHTGQELILTVNANESVVVDTAHGTPSISMVIGASTRYATYVSGSGTNALKFAYTIQAGDIDADGIAVGALTGNGGTLKDAAGNDMDLNLNSVSSTTDVLVDAIAPVVNSVSVPANGTYYSGQALDFTVNFSETVSVDTSSGTPRIALTLDTGGTVYADYVSGSGTSTLAFRHVVANGELDANGITVGALGANGATLRDATGNDATLTLNSVGSTALVNLDGTPSQVSGITSSASNGDYRAGATIQISVAFTKAVTVDTAGGTPTLALASGGTATYASGSGSSTLVFNYTVGDGENAADLDYSSASALSLNGAAIKESSGAHLDALLALATPGAAGSLGNSKDIVIDTTAPTTSVAGVAFSNDTGTSTTDFLTKTAAQTISGTLSANLATGESVYVSLDNGATWSAASATVGQNAWSLAGQTLTGSNTLKVKVADAAGNDGTIFSQAYTLDTTAPTINASGSAPADNASSGSISGDIVLKFSEALQVGSDTSKVYLKDAATDGTVTATVTVNGNGELVIHLGHNLSYSTAYYVNWDGGALLDAAGNAASAVTDKTAYNFTTEGEPPAPPPVPKDDGDDIPATTEQQVPSLPPATGGSAVAGDGNGDGKPDSEQANVTSTPFLMTDTAQSNPGSAAPVYVTLVADAVEGKTDTTKTDTAVLKEVKQLDAPADLPSDMQLPLGQISFKTALKTAGAAESFSLYVDGSVAVNGYWKQNKAGDWVNLASAEHGGKVVTEGGKTRLDFTIVDGGEFDNDGKADGVITDPGGPGYRVIAGTTIADTDKDQFPDNLEAANGLAVGTKDNDVFGSSKLFVMELYRDILFREAEPGGLAYWQARIDGGVQDRAQVASAFLDSPEFQSGAGGIARLYFGALGRLPDNAGMDTWMGKQQAGTSLAAIADSFAASAEFQAKFGALDNAGFVQQLYQNVLHRPAEQAGIGFWTGQLAAGASRGQVLLGFTESAEHRAVTDTEVTVALNYVGLLGRTPEQAGFDHWVGLAGQGMTEVQIIGSFMAAPEYHDRFLP